MIKVICGVCLHSTPQTDEEYDACACLLCRMLYEKRVRKDMIKKGIARVREKFRKLKNIKIFK
jgi:hypothetical protein